MQRGFTKLFNTIVTSTIWQEDDKTRIVWITMLAIADAFGNVFAAIPGLASVANVSIEAAGKAVANLLAPDEWSRTKDFEGRRIEVIDGGWHILNYGKYRKMMDEEERREYKARWARENRQKVSKTIKDKCRQIGTNVDRDGQSGHIPSASSSSSKCTQKEAEEFCISIGLPRSDGEAMFLHWEEQKWPKNWKLTIKKWKSFGYMPSQKRAKAGARPDSVKPVDPSKVELPERFKAWGAEHYPDKREEIMKWQTWADVPNSLRQEWWRIEKLKLPIGELI
jgi:hypothetical protein